MKSKLSDDTKRTIEIIVMILLPLTSCFTFSYGMHVFTSSANLTTFEVLKATFCVAYGITGIFHTIKFFLN